MVSPINLNKMTVYCNDEISTSVDVLLPDDTTVHFETVPIEITAEPLPTPPQNGYIWIQFPAQLYRTSNAFYNSVVDVVFLWLDATAFNVRAYKADGSFHFLIGGRNANAGSIYQVLDWWMEIAGEEVRPQYQILIKDSNDNLLFQGTYNDPNYSVTCIQQQGCNDNELDCGSDNCCGCASIVNEISGLRKLLTGKMR